MVTVLVATLLVSSASLSATQRLSLELGHIPSAGETPLLEVRFRARGSTDVYFNRGAVRLEILDPRGDRAPYMCADKRGRPEYDRLRPGEAISERMGVSCYQLEPGKKYTVTAVFDDGGDDFRDEAPSGAVWVIGPIRSNSVVMRPGEPHNKALQTDGASRRR